MDLQVVLALLSVVWVLLSVVWVLLSVVLVLLSVVWVLLSVVWVLLSVVYVLRWCVVCVTSVCCMCAVSGNMCGAGEVRHRCGVGVMMWRWYTCGPG